MKYYNYIINIIDGPSFTKRALFYDVAAGFITLYSGSERMPSASFSCTRIESIICIGEAKEDANSKLDSQ